MQKVSNKAWITLPYEQATGDLIWELTKDYSSFLLKKSRTCCLYRPTQPQWT